MKYAITGGAGFIGSNTADRILQQGHEVIVIDNLSRRGSEANLAWLTGKHAHLQFEKIDIRDAEAMTRVFSRHHPIDRTLHFAGQVAVTSSVEDPREDFEINAMGTFNVLEAIRKTNPVSLFLYSSTNKVYGALDQLEVLEDASRYRYSEGIKGVSESTLLDFHSPYGCSKGSADQYVRDYHRIYGMNTLVFRNSCIYGPRQFGIEDQGWLAWFVIAAVTQKPITIYGNGKQVRDVLHVEDLIRAMLLAMDRVEVTAGQVYNIGGGAENSISVWEEFGPMLEGLLGHEIPVARADWRPGDQPLYISDISKAHRDFGWRPEIGVQEGIRSLFDWVAAHLELFR
jgi:CDP-paratose 2-epimerase